MSIRRTVSLAALLACASTAFAQDGAILVEPISRPHALAFKPSAQTRLGMIGSSIASWTKPGVSLINQGSLIVAINRKVEAKAATVTKLLEDSGQKGVLIDVRVDKALTETDHWELRGDDVVVLGAGTSPLDVALAESQINSVDPVLRQGYRGDKEQSYYIWFVKEGNQIVGHYEHGGLLERKVAFQRGEQALSQINDSSRNRAMDAALSSMSANWKDARAKADAASFRASRSNQTERFEKINGDLSNELKKAARANAAASTFELVANAAQIGSSAMNIAAERGWLKSSMDDVDGKIDKAATREELKSAAQGIAKQVNEKVDELRASQNALRVQMQRTRDDIFKFLQSNDYPLNEVPQTRLP